MRSVRRVKVFSMKNKNTAMKAGIGYTIGNVLVKGINFLTLPIFSRMLTTEEFGVCNVFLSYDAILSVLVSLAIHTSIKSAHYEFKRTDEYTSSVTLIFWINAFFYSFIIFLGGTKLANFIGFKESILFLLIPYSFSSAVIQLYNQRISLEYEYKKYLLVSLLNSCGNVIVSIFLITTVFRFERDLGRIVGTVAPILVIALVLLHQMYKRARPKFNKVFLKFALVYSLPIVPHGISQVLLGQCDRIMISNMIGNSAAGIYSLAGNLKLVLTVITTSISVSWSTWFFSKMENKEYNEITENSKLLVRLFLIFTVGLMALSPEIIYVLGGKGYEAGKLVAVPMIMDAFILFLYNIIVPSEYYTKKTTYIMTGTLIAAVINLLTNYIFIKKYGYIAAAYTTLFSYVCYLVLHIIISRRLAGFNVVNIGWIILTALIVAFTGAIDLVLVNNILARYISGLVVIMILCPPLVKYLLTSARKKKES